MEEDPKYLAILVDPDIADKFETYRVHVDHHITIHFQNNGGNSRKLGFFCKTCCQSLVAIADREYMAARLAEA